MVLDAKYKNLNGAVDREDSLQMLAYMLRFSADCGLFIYPSQQDSAPRVLELLQNQEQTAKRVELLPLRIPDYEADETFADFSTKMAAAEAEFLGRI